MVNIIRLINGKLVIVHLSFSQHSARHSKGKKMKVKISSLENLQQMKESLNVKMKFISPTP